METCVFDNYIITFASVIIYKEEKKRIADAKKCAGSGKAGVYKVEYSPPPPVEGGIQSKGLEMGKKIKSLKKRKKN